MFGLTTRAVTTNSPYYKHQPHQYATSAARARNQVATKHDDGDLKKVVETQKKRAKAEDDINAKIGKFYEEFEDCEPLDPC